MRGFESVTRSRSAVRRCFLLADFFFDFERTFGVKLGFFGGKLVQQAQKLTGVHQLFVGNFPEHFDRQRVVGRFGQLRVHLGRFVFSGHHETDGANELKGAELLALGKA